MMYCEKTPGRRLRPAVKESCDRSLSPCHLRAMILTALLMLFSMGVGAKVTVETGKFTGGTVVEKTQTENAADGTVTVTLTVTPAKGYAISKKDITVVATIAPSSSRGSSRRNAPEIGDALELKGDDPKDLSQPRDYTVTVDANLGVWVKEAKFQEKRDDTKAGTDDTPVGNDYSGTYYIASVGYDGNPENTNNYYLCPTKGWCSYKATDDFEAGDNMPFLTTYRCKTSNYTDGANNAVWYVEKHPTQNYYYIKQASTGKYLTSNGTIRTTNNPDRMRVHLETVAPENLDDKELFTIEAYNNYLTISPKGVVGGAADRNWLTVNGGNKNALTGQSGKTGGPTGYANTVGIIGVYTQNDANAPFYLEKAITLDPPSITNNNDGTFTISTATGATIYYTTDGTTPTTSTSTTGTTSVNITQTEGMTGIKAIAKATSDNFPTPVVTYILPVCERPTIKVSGGTVTITCSTAGAAIHYTTNGDPATALSTTYAGPFAKGDATTIRAIATKAGYVISSEVIYLPPTEVSSSSEMTDMNGNYLLTSTFTSSGSVGTSTNPFKGTIDGDRNQITLSHPLVAYADGAIIKNVIIGNVSISSGTNVGAICGEATGDTRIYNCGVLDGSVGGSNNVGGIVGLLDGRSRVINCYNYAKITSGSNCGGIVGYNNVASTSGNLQTMVMNCMFYGNIEGDNAAPIYGGANIHNKYASDDDTGLNNYCYFLYDEEKNPYVKTIVTGNYHGALGAEERYLNRFEFFRMTLNSTRNLAAYYATGDATQKGEMAKWVLDKSIAPYPILKVQDTYPSIVNPDYAHATTQTERNKGGLLGTLSVTISGTGSGAVFSAPTGASITTGSLTLNVTDKDYDNFNFNYKKVQLPYYNEVGIGNYTKASDGTGRVVTGWKITSIMGGTPGSFTTDTYDYPSFNFVDRKCTNKDLYSVSGRVFAQGAYWEVPDGVTSITIEPYWAKAVYLTDANYDVTYSIKSGSTATTNKYGVTVCGSCPMDCNGQTVCTNLSTAMTNLGSDADHTVYDYAVVLVGNYHQAANDALVNNGTPVTFMSADLDGDNEPDNTLFYYHNQRKSVSPVRFDFLNIPGIGMMKRTYDSSMDPEPGIFCPKGWFEVTNTVFIRFGQFEYAGSSSSASGNPQWPKTSMAPLILQGGIYEQFVSCCRTNAQNTNYLLIGGNAWFKNFANGCHTANPNKTPKVPINVTGGDYTNFYLTGIYQPAAAEASENAECYIDGGRFTEVAGTGMQQLKGNVTWLINAADITSFFGGGINAAKPITGSISTTISNSYVDEFYGGPKFGDMTAGMTVTTNATDCHFGKYFGAGYGGTAFNRVGYVDDSKPHDTKDWDGYVDSYYKRASGNGGISTNYEYEFILHSDGNQTVARFFVNYASLSLASTRNVTSTLSGCNIGTFYGGGNLGAVNGDVNSTLTNCTVTGNAFGAGFSASVPTVEVWNAGAYLTPNPTYNRTANVFNNASVKTPKDNGQYVVYTWSDNDTYFSNNSPFYDVADDPSTTDINEEKHYIHTDVSLDGLGAVSGNVTLTLNGATTVGGSVYGGGEESVVGADTEVIVTSGTIGAEGQGGAEYGNVYGGGKGKDDDVLAGLVKGNTKVEISNGRIYHNVYGGGAYGSVGDFEYNTSGMPTGLKANTTGGKTEVYITGGTIGWNGKENGMVFGSSRGDVGTPEAIEDKMAWVHNTHVIIGKAGTPASGTEGEEGYVPATAASGPDIMGSVYGSGENGHVFENTVVDVHGGTVGISSGVKVTDDSGKEYEGAAYPYRGNVYGGGCGTDMYDSDGDNTLDSYNPLAGIVQGNTTVTIDGGHVVRNVYGAGAMGSVGIATTSGKVTTISGGQTTINISGGTIGVDGKNGDGNVFGAARGSTEAISNKYALARKGTNVSVTGGTIEGNVYGGGELGCVGTYDISDDIRTFTWQDVDGNRIPNPAANSDSKNTGGCKVTVNGGSAVIKGHVFGAGKGKDDTFWCEKGIAYSTDVSVTNGTVNGNVYGGGEVGRVETDTQVKIGDGDGTAEGAIAPTITGSVFGGGAGVETHGYSALVRGNTTVNVEGNAKVGHSVYGGGEIASVGKYALDGNKMPSILQGGGYCYVTVQGYATIGADVFGAGEGVKSHFDKDNADPSKRSRRMTLKDNWQSLAGDDRFAWDYLQNESDYSTYLETLALATHPEVTINGNASIGGSVFGGGELGLTKGSVIVNIKGGTIAEDVYGGGSLANTNTTSSVDNDGDGEADLTVHPTTTVKLTGGTVEGNAYGGGLGQLGTNPIEAKVYGDVLVTLNETETAGEGGTTVYNDNCVVKGSIFGCNNLNGSPQGKVTVHIYKTQGWTDDKGTPDDTSDDVSHQGTSEANLHKSDAAHSYHLAAVYGGGNMAAYVPKELSTGTTDVIIDGCGLTSIQTVYGGGNAASTPATNVTINGTYEIDEVFGGGNGKDDIVINGETKPNPGANVGFRDYSAVESEYDTKEKRLEDDFVNSYVYGTGKASVNIFGGTIHRVFGGSNTKGNVRQTAVTMLEEAGGCDFCVDEAYGGGKSAPMDAEAKLLMACIPGLSAAYGGAEAADIMGNVTLNITNGTFERVFGGNNLSGTISGAITVNIEEVGCKPIIIGELYGGGNQAAYSVFGYKKYGTSTVVRTSKDDEDAIFTPSTPYSDDQFFADPQVNVKSFTSIGTVYGGGYGADAVMVGNPTVNVSVVEGAWKDYAGDISHYTESGYVYDATGYKGETLTIEDNNGSHSVSVPSHAVGKIGAINNVFGGGNAAEVKGNTNVNIGTLAKVSIKEYVEKTVTAGGSVEGLYTRTGAGTVASPYRYTAATGTAEEGTTYYEEKAVEKDVIGADIRGNVYGGGNNAAVTGDTNVNIGKKATE